MFQSTRPAWGATKARRRGLAAVYVSIHAPRVGRDGQSGQHRTCQSVSIHAPRVGRDRVRTLRHPERIVSIHAPRVGRDHRLRLFHQPRKGFNPRAPRGARLRRGLHGSGLFLFQSTRPAWGATGTPGTVV